MSRINPKLVNQNGISVLVPNLFILATGFTMHNENLLPLHIMLTPSTICQEFLPEPVPPSLAEAHVLVTPIEPHCYFKHISIGDY